MKTDFAVNVSRAEAIRRFVLGTVLLGAFFASPAVPSWIALFACYPLFTAMFQWDPANALFQKIVAKSSKQVQDTLFRQSTTA